MYTATRKDGEQVTYRDGKRLLWMMPAVIALVVPFTVMLYFWSDKNPFTLLFQLLYFFAIIPTLDLLVGEDSFNPPEEILAQMADDQYYRGVLYGMIPLYYGSFILGAWLVGTQALPFWAVGLFSLGLGVLHANVLTIGHELGHKHSKADQWAAKIIIAIIGYGHFCIEHNRGHHVHVSTPEDPASSRMGESIYAFAMRELPGAMKRGWGHERERLSRKGLSFWSVQNDILQGYAITLGIAAILLAIFGWVMVPFLLIHHFAGWYGLTQANYVEHYGLKRKKLENGRYEPCAPHHSWNTNHICSNLLTFHLQRHSDHHANPQRPYQVLRNFPDLPRLPSGYPGCYGLAAIPPLWFRVMNPKVLEWADGDMDKINLQPGKFD